MQWLIERFKSDSSKCAFIANDRIVSYAEIIERIEEFCHLLGEAGIKKGDKVVLSSEFSPEAFCMILSLAIRQCISIPLSKNSIVEQSEALSISGCDWMISIDEGQIDPIIIHKTIKVENLVLDQFRKSCAPGIILFSSGSTGKPKGMLHDFNRVIEKFRAQRQGPVAIPFLMIDHFGGINTILAITSSLGTVVTVKDRSVERICEAIQAHNVDLLPTTPSFLTLLIATNAHKKFNLSSLRRITYGTEVMPQSTLDRLHREFPSVNLHQTYGLSEVGVLHSKSRGDGSLWMRIGGDGFQTKVIDGVLWVRSDFAMIGYLNAPSEFDGQGWFNTQDKVEVDGDYFKILGRITDLINVGGQKVYPVEVESIILAMDNIKDVAVFGEPHALLGEIVVAKVVLERPESAMSVKKRIRKICFEKLSSYKAPAKVVLADGNLYNSRQKKLRR